MKQLIYVLALSTLVLFNSGCLGDNDGVSGQTGNQANDGEWLIPQNQVRDGGPGKDGIPSIDNPRFSAIEAIDFLEDNDLVLVMRVDGEVHVYPHPILDWHEIINDDFGDKSVAITYCPLTGTAVGWNRVLEGKKTTFGVSGLLYNSNLIPYDRETDSNWTQMGLVCVNGELIGTIPETYQLLETSWASAKKMFPDAMVVTDDTGFSRNYQQYPYGTYRTDNRLIFPVDERDETLHPKERVLGIIADANDVKAYEFQEFKTAGLIQDSFGGQSYVILGSQTDNYLMAYVASAGQEFMAITDPSDPTILMEDNEGNRWDIFGLAVSGPRQGDRLEGAEAFIGFWFSWAAFYPSVELY